MNQDAQILSQLDDVCVKKVFQCLHLHDLCNAADVCKRFRTLSGEVFKSDFANQKILDISQLIEGNTEFHNQWFMVRWLTEKFMVSAERLFRNFGHLIKALQLTGTGERRGMDENELLMLVNTYCRTSLRELKLVEFGRSDDFSKELIPLFGGLQKLSLMGIFGADVSDSFVACLGGCQNLKRLHVDGIPATMWNNHKFPKLKSLIMSNNWEFEHTEFNSFLKLHQNLRTLKGDNFFSILSTDLPNLETLYFCFGDFLDYEDDTEEVEENMLQLSKLKSLKNLTFSGEASVLNVLIAALEKEQDHTPIEYLNLVECEIESEVVVALSKLGSLKTLALTRCEITKDALIDVNTRLNRINKVVVEDIDLDGNITEIAENVCVVNSIKTSIRKHQNLDQDSADILNMLNDDCIVEIFEFLSLCDLCNVAEVCKQFRENAQKTFQLHHTTFKTDELTTADNAGLFRTDMIMVEKLFRNFGFFIQELEVNGRFLKNNTEQETIMFMATKYCTSVLFKTLTLDHIYMDVEMRWLFPLLGIFGCLPKLELHSCRLNKDFGKFLSVCYIPTIQVCLTRGSTEWLNHKFCYLRSIILIDIWLPESTKNEFVKLNGHIQTLAIHESNLSSEIFKDVADHMPNLEEFYFYSKYARDRKTRKNVLKLAKLKSLKKLTLNCSSFSVKNLIDELSKEATPLTELNICFGTFDMELLEKMHNLKSPLTSLQLSRVHMKNVSLIDVVKKLPELHQLDIDIKGIFVNDIIKMLPFAEKLSKLLIESVRSNIQIDIDAFQSILMIVKGRRKATKLSIHISSENPLVFVPKHLLRENVYWIQIENEIGEKYSFNDSESENVELQESDSNSATEDEEADDGSVVSDSFISGEVSDDGSVMSAEGSDDGSVMSVEDSDNDIEMEMV